MVAVTFDTHKFVRKLKESGFNDQQAEALTDAVQEAQAAADIATKADLREYESALRNDLEKLEMRLDTKFAGMDAKFADLRKDMAAMEERFNARFDKLWLQLVISLSGVVVVALGVFASFPKVFGH